MRWFILIEEEKKMGHKKIDIRHLNRNCFAQLLHLKKNWLTIPIWWHKILQQRKTNRRKKVKRIPDRFKVQTRFIEEKKW